MSSKKSRRFTPQQKADAVDLVRSVGSVSRVAKDLGLVPSVLYKWVKQSGIDREADPQGPLTTQEREELRRLRRENNTLRTERDFLKKAAAFFAKDGDQPSS